MWTTNATQTAVWKKLEDGTYVYEEAHPEEGPFCWKMPSKYNYSKYKNKLTTRAEEMVVCPHCHSPLSIYGGCKNCNMIQLFMEKTGIRGV